jgi:hypothetical protein
MSSPQPLPLPLHHWGSTLLSLALGLSGLLLLATLACFVVYLTTTQVRYRRRGAILGAWTLFMLAVCLVWAISARA